MSADDQRIEPGKLDGLTGPEIPDINDIEAPEDETTEVTETPTEVEDGPQAQTQETPQEATTLLDPKVREELENRERALFEQKAMIDAQREELAEFRRLKELRANNPLAAMKELGIDRMSVAEQMMGEDAKPKLSPEMQRAFQMIEQQRNEVSTLRQQISERDDKRLIFSHLQSKPDDYAFLNTIAQENPQIVDDIYREVMSERAANRRPDLLSILERKEAAFAEDIFRSLTPLTKNAKVKNRLSELLQDKASIQPEATSTNSSKTLKNNMASDPPKEGPMPKTPEEAREWFEKQKVSLFDND